MSTSEAKARENGSDRGIGESAPSAQEARTGDSLLVWLVWFVWLVLWVWRCARGPPFARARLGGKKRERGREREGKREKENAPVVVSGTGCIAACGGRERGSMDERLRERGEMGSARTRNTRIRRTQNHVLCLPSHLHSSCSLQQAFGVRAHQKPSFPSSSSSFSSSLLTEHGWIRVTATSFLPSSLPLTLPPSSARVVAPASCTPSGSSSAAARSKRCEGKGEKMEARGRQCGQVREDNWRVCAWQRRRGLHVRGRPLGSRASRSWGP